MSRGEVLRGFAPEASGLLATRPPDLLIPFANDRKNNGAYRYFVYHAFTRECKYNTFLRSMPGWAKIFIDCLEKAWVPDAWGAFA
jgi:hypothetical protein